MVDVPLMNLLVGDGEKGPNTSRPSSPRVGGTGLTFVRA
jgi:hypothetical protein